jgi:hypothetical protein
MLLCRFGLVGIGELPPLFSLCAYPDDFCSHDDFRTIHHRDLQQESMKGYSLIVSCLVYFVLRCHRGWNCEYKMELTSAQHGACAYLEQVLRPTCAHREVLNDESSELLGEPNLDGCLELGDDVGEDSDDEVYEDAETSPVEDSPPTGSKEPMGGQIAVNVIQVGILNVLMSLYTHLPAGKDDKFFSPVVRFAVLFSLRKSGQWLPPRQITRILAVLLFSGRQVMMALMHRQVLDNCTIRYSQCVR